MKCISCNERNGSARCEGCSALFCLPCMNKHHDDLAQRFQQLWDVRNDMRQCLNTIKSTSTAEKQIDEWEHETVRRIQQIAAQARTNANEIVSNHMEKIVHRFEQLSGSMQQQEKQGDYLENDIEQVKKQFDQMQDDIERVNEMVQIDFTASKNVEWDALIYIEQPKPPKSVSMRSTQQKESQKSVPTNKSFSTTTGVNKPVMRAPESGSIPVHVMRSKSFSVNSNQRTHGSGTCTLCHRIFHHSTSAHFCENCIQRLPSSILGQNNGFQSPARSDNFVVPVPAASVTKNPSLIYCLRCDVGNLSDDSLANATYFCRKCRNLVYSA